MSKTTARARANARELGDVPTQLAALEKMNVGQLAEKYRELYGEPTRTRNKEYLRKRLAWRIQELAEGGLPASASSASPSSATTCPSAGACGSPRRRRTLGPVQAHEPRDPRVPSVGTVLRRVFNGVAHEVTICAEGFDYAGERFKTLSAIAKHITGTPWNGFLFFGLKKRVETTSEESAA
jgi:hypothetical protein